MTEEREQIVREVREEFMKSMAERFEREKERKHHNAS